MKIWVNVKFKGCEEVNINLNGNLSKMEILLDEEELKSDGVIAISDDSSENFKEESIAHIPEERFEMDEKTEDFDDISDKEDVQENFEESEGSDVQQVTEQEDETNGTDENGDVPETSEIPESSEDIENSSDMSQQDDVTNNSDADDESEEISEKSENVGGDQQKVESVTNSDHEGTESSAKPKAKKSAKVSLEDKIPQLAEFAEKCESYDGFCNSICKWIDFGARNEFFMQVLEAAKEAKTISWKDIFDILTRNGVKFVNNDKLQCTLIVAEKFKDSANKVSIMHLIKGIVEYQNFNFKTNAGSYFDELFEDLDDTQDPEEKVKNILLKMGYDKKPESGQNKIFKIVMSAIKSEKTDFSSVFSQTDIPESEESFSRILIAQLIKDFVSEKGIDKSITSEEFFIALKDHMS